MDSYGFRVQDLHTYEGNSKYMSIESNGHSVTLPATRICLHYLFVKNPLALLKKQPSKILQQPEESVQGLKIQHIGCLNLDTLGDIQGQGFLALSISPGVFPLLLFSFCPFVQEVQKKVDSRLQLCHRYISHLQKGVYGNQRPKQLGYGVGRGEEQEELLGIAIQPWSDSMKSL